MFTFTYNATEAELADGTNRIKSGGYYKGTITHAEIKSKEKGFTLELECVNEAGEATGKQFLVLTTKEGATVDKNGKILSGRSKLSALLALLGLKVMTSSLELIGKKIAFLGKMKESFSEKDQKSYLNFEILNFMDPLTNQTYSEKVKKEPAQRYTALIPDDVLSGQSNNQKSESTGNNADDSTLPF